MANKVKVLNIGGNLYEFEAVELYYGTNKELVFPADEVVRIYNIVKPLVDPYGDDDTLINKLQEVFNFLSDYTEETDLLDELNKKSDKTHTHTVTAKGSVSQPSFTGTQATITVSGTSKGTVSVSTEAVDAANGKPSNYTPAGTVKAHSYTPAGSITGSQSFTGTASQTSSTAATVASSTHTHGVTAKGSISVAAAGSSTPNYTPAGTVGAPTPNHTSTATNGPSATETVPTSGHTHRTSCSASRLPS